MTVLLAADERTREMARARVRELIDRLSATGRSNFEEVLRLLADTRARLLAALPHGTEFDTDRANAMVRAIDFEMARLRMEMGPVIARGFRQSMALGDADALEKARAVLPGSLGLSSGVSVNLAEVALGRSADLVGLISATARANLNALMTRSGVGSSRPADVARAIGDVLAREGRPPGIFGTLATQVERVHRTEVSSLYETATQVRMKRISTESPYEMRKRWISVLDSRTRPSHVAMNGVTVAVGEQFVLAGYPCDGPHDSNLPAEEAVNCRCTVAMVRGELKAARASVRAA